MQKIVAHKIDKHCYIGGVPCRGNGKPIELITMQNGSMILHTNGRTPAIAMYYFKKYLERRKKNECAR